MRKTGNEFPGKGNRMWYQAKEEEEGKPTITVWFRNKEDRDYFINGGDIDFNWGNDNLNKFFNRRIDNVKKNTVNIKDGLIKVRNQIDELLSQI